MHCSQNDANTAASKEVKINLTRVVGELHRVDGVHLKAQNLEGEDKVRVWNASTSVTVSATSLQVKMQHKTWWSWTGLDDLGLWLGGTTAAAAADGWKTRVSLKPHIVDLPIIINTEGLNTEILWPMNDEIIASSWTTRINKLNGP